MRLRPSWLWFDVESRYKATERQKNWKEKLLWFDVESRYKATKNNIAWVGYGCGLM